ncbi:hypothetical protein DIE19_00090 [Burkholderia sp. Bp9126]|nr:hypothetical protein DIE19_00090 [Burkholderia sp. Bp9126]
MGDSRLMPPARPTGARRSGRAPAYGARTHYLPDTDHTAHARRTMRGGAPEPGGRTDPPARNACARRRQRRF